MQQQPLVSVKVATYNHERYIEQCLSGILAQQTTFPFEVIVGEDCSTDGTRAIVQAYAAAHPDMIRVVTSESNVGPARNIARVRAACRGVYEALCEGDDYWIHPQKLQRQVEFLETHPDYTLCFHDAIRFFEDKRAQPKYYCPPDLPATPTMADIIHRPSFIPTASIVARRTFLDSLPAWRTELICADLVVRLWSAHIGRIGYLDTIMSVKRQHATGLTYTTSHRRMGQDAIRAYRLFDEATNYQYTALLRERISYEQQHSRLGRLYYLLHPIKAMNRSRQRRSGAGL